MRKKIKNIIIYTIAFLIHLAIAIFLGGLGYISKYGLFGSPNPEEIVSGNIAMFSGIILFAASVFMLIKRDFNTYIFSVLIALFAMIAWFLLERSIDMPLFIFAYLIVFIPLSIYKYKINNLK